MTSGQETERVHSYNPKPAQGTFGYRGGLVMLGFFAVKLLVYWNF